MASVAHTARALAHAQTAQATTQTQEPPDATVSEAIEAAATWLAGQQDLSNASEIIDRRARSLLNWACSSEAFLLGLSGLRRTRPSGQLAFMIPAVSAACMGRDRLPAGGSHCRRTAITRPGC